MGSGSRLLVVGCLWMLLFSCHGKASREEVRVTPPARNEMAMAPVVTDTLFYKVRPAADTSHPVLLILLHGMGANEDDLLGLAGLLPANYIVVSARAPYVLRPGSYQWYQSTSTATTFDGVAAHLDHSRALIRSLILDMQARYHVTAAHTVVAGFSQGAVMSYEMALKDPGLCAAIGVLSGTVLFSTQQQTPNTQHPAPAIFIGHGKADHRIPLAAAQASYD